MPDLEPIAPLIPVPPVSKDEPTGRFRRPVIPPPDEGDEEDQDEKPTVRRPPKPPEDGHIDEYA